jgi:hypothetical protein
MAVMVIVTTVRAAFGLERSLNLSENCPEAGKHVFDHMVGPDTEGFMSNLRRQMTVAEMPCKAHKLARVFMPHLDNGLCCRLNHEPPPIVKLHTISISHGDSLRKIEQDILALIGRQPNPAPMARIEIECDSACGIFLRPIPGRSMNESRVYRHINT